MAVRCNMTSTAKQLHKRCSLAAFPLLGSDVAALHSVTHFVRIQNSLYNLEILKFLNYSYMYFAKIMTRKAKVSNLTNMTELYPFLV